MQSLGEPNPFAVPFDVMFTGPEGGDYLVPGFYDGDGQGGLDGNVWKVRFSAGTNGAWSWRSRSTEPRLDGVAGRFEVLDPPADAPEFYRAGRLEYVNERYLKFREGGYWLKAGADEPENLLGTAFGDWAGKKRQIDHLAAAGINSVYIMTHNLDGDLQDVWPWAGATQEEAKRNPDRFDVARLEQWRDLFEYIQSKGIVIQLVLEDDSAWTGHDYARYYREIIARFGYLPAVYFNFCEEYNESHSLEDALGYMKLLAGIDPYNHPRAIHNVNLPAPAYVDSAVVQLASIQTDPSKPASLNRLAVDWFQAPLARRQRPMVVSFDEARPAGDRRSWWSVFMGGGIWESLVSVDESYAEFDAVWRELHLARAFMESLPFERMFPANHVLRRGRAFCLARPGVIYALYLPSGGAIEVDLVAGNRYRARWYDPRGPEAEPWREAVTIDGGRQALEAPDTRDWAVRIDKIEGDGEAPPTAVSARLTSTNNQPVSVHLAVVPADAFPDVEYEIVTPPSSGSLAGSGPDRTFTPRRGFTGRDRFQWRAQTATGASNLATVLITANASGVNSPPRASSQTVRVTAGTSHTFILRYTDRDGPGPYRIRITQQPAHGAIQGLDNDITYTPAPGFRGTDTIEWSVSDGQARSDRATVRILVRE